MLSTACGESDGDDGVTAAETTSDGTASTTMTTSSTDPSNTESTTATSTETTTASTSASTTTAETEDTSATTATEDTSASTSATDDTGAVACGDDICGADEVCVQPCCGGPPPGCFDTTREGTCEDGGEPVPAAECPVPCSTEMCCPPQPCEAAPDFCAGMAELQCHETQCSLGDCFGTLQDGALFCECA